MRALSVGLSLALLSAPAWAQDGPPAEPTVDRPRAEARPPEDTPVVRLPEVVVTPTRHAADPFDTPATVRTLDGADGVLARGGRTVAEVAGQIPGVEVQKTAQGMTTVFMRGFTGFRTLVLLDGIRLNNSILRSGPNEWMGLIDPYRIDRMEAVEGPGSVLYGSDAVGGTVNILASRILAGASGDPDGPFALHRRLIYRYGSADQSNTVRAEMTGTWGSRFGVRVGGTWRDFDDLEGGRHVGTQQKTGFDAVAGDVTAEWQMAKGVMLRASVTHMDLDDVMRSHKTVFGFSWHGTTVGSELARLLDYERTFATVHLELDDIGGALQDVRVSLVGGALRKNRDRTKSNGKRDLRFVRVNTGGIVAQATTPIGDAARVVYGFDYYHDDVDSGRQDFAAGTGLLSSTKIQGSVADDARYDLLGAFAQLEWSLTDGLDTILGARFTWADTYAGELQDPVSGSAIALDETFTDLSGAAQLLWKPNDTERLHVALAQSFRAPNLSDLTRLDTAQTNEQEVPSPGLDPERFLTFEVGFKSRRGPVTMEASYFYTWISDMIVRTPTGAVLPSGDLEVTKTNVGDGYTQGASGAVEYLFDTGWMQGVSATVGASWTEGAHDVFLTSSPGSKSREPKSKMPPATGFVRLRYESSDGRWWAEFEAKAARSQERLSPADIRDTQRTPPGGMPGYAVFAIRGGATLSENLTVNVGLENLADRDYRMHGSGVNEPGMHAVLTVAWEF